MGSMVIDSVIIIRGESWDHIRTTPSCPMDAAIDLVVLAYEAAGPPHDECQLDAEW
jgi:hypothetical protein